MVLRTGPPSVPGALVLTVLVPEVTEGEEVSGVVGVSGGVDESLTVLLLRPFIAECLYPVNESML